MPEELGSTLNNLKNIKEKIYGDLTIFSGEWKLKKINTTPLYLSVAWSGWGKVSAARAATRLISEKVNKVPLEVIFFTGVAGAFDPCLKQWDIVLPTSLIQHDMDARPIFEKYVIPALKSEKIISNKDLFDWTLSTLSNSISLGKLNNFGKIHTGIIATGDKFVSNKKDLNHLQNDFKNFLAVEMEGAAVAQVAMQEGIPFQVIRVISDETNESSHEDFNLFLSKYCCYSAEIIVELMKNINNKDL